ncbi:hypothetical protein GCK32_005213 [Trichostrongylus colubriformis]|uniref:Uncharacterized protein n=1 Tax=Trichostrongylus colubriformis TaxID=6319 RepID=A0AAN8IAD9_TRICO
MFSALVGVAFVIKFVQVGSHREPTNATRLDLFLAEAKAKGFPLEYTWMDCALRGYGVFVMWMHLVVYLIFRYIHGDDHDRKDYIGLLEERPSAKPTAFTPTTQVTAATPIGKAAKDGSKKGSSSRSSRKSKKKSRKTGKKGKKNANNKDEEDDCDIESAGTQASERIPLEVVYPQRLRLMKEFIVDYKKYIDRQPELRGRLPSRAPRGHQLDKLTSMDRFLEKLETVEGPSSRERYSQEGLLEVATTQSTRQSLEIAPTPPSERPSIRDMIKEPFVATADATATEQSTLLAKETEYAACDKVGYYRKELNSHLKGKMSTHQATNKKASHKVSYFECWMKSMKLAHRPIIFFLIKQFSICCTVA